MTDLPKVSGVLPIGYGDKYFRVALTAFLASNYEGELEVIIVDNSDEPIQSLLPSDDRIKYYRTPRMGVDALRNLGTSYATGDVIISVDEDDWSSTDRVSKQVSRLIETGKAVTGFHSLYYHDGSTGTTYKYWYEVAGRNHPPYAAGTSQCYLKTWWEKHQFPATGIEDWPFSQEALTNNQLDSIDGAQLVVARYHADSVCAPRSLLGQHRQFPAVPKSELPPEFYKALSASSVATKATTKSKPKVTGE